MRYLQAVLIGVASAVLLAAVVLCVDMIRAGRVMTSQMATCDGLSSAAGGVAVCGSSVQVGSIWALVAAFIVGFAVAVVWFLRSRRLGA